MSEPIPESIPTSADPRSHRPVKKARGANTALASQADAIDNLFYDPTKQVTIPALSSDSKSSLAAPPEIVANVQGSSAGAGSGEFHVYKASRRREYERLRTMDEEAKKEDDDEKWAREERERKEKDEEKTRKNREKRNKKKGRKGGSGKEDPLADGGGKKPAGEDDRNGGVKKALQIPKLDNKDDHSSENGFGVAEVIAETGITIHDDD